MIKVTEHWLVGRNPETDGHGNPALGWVLAVGYGSPPQWARSPGVSGKRKWATEAIAAVTRDGDVSAAVTISPLTLDKLEADPDELPIAASLNLVCRTSKVDKRLWSLCVLDEDGELRVSCNVAGSNVHRLLDELVKSIDDGALDQSVLWVRPDWFASEIARKPTAGRSPTFSFAG